MDLRFLVGLDFGVSATFFQVSQILMIQHFDVVDYIEIEVLER